MDGRFNPQTQTPVTWDASGDRSRRIEPQGRIGHGAVQPFSFAAPYLKLETMRTLSRSGKKPFPLPGSVSVLTAGTIMAGHAAQAGRHAASRKVL